MRALAAALLLGASSAQALMVGQAVTLEHVMNGSVYETLAENVPVSDGIEGQLADLYAVDVLDASIRITQINGANWAPADFNGLHLYSAGATFESFCTDYETTFQNWKVNNIQRITLDARNLWINFESLSILPGQVLVINLNPPSPVPEPSTTALLAIGGVLLLSRRYLRH
jgi:hypothetical protein